MLHKSGHMATSLCCGIAFFFFKKKKICGNNGTLYSLHPVICSNPIPRSNNGPRALCVCVFPDNRRGWLSGRVFLFDPNRQNTKAFRYSLFLRPVNKVRASARPASQSNALLSTPPLTKIATQTFTEATPKYTANSDICQLAQLLSEIWYRDNRSCITEKAYSLVSFICVTQVAV